MKQRPVCVLAALVLGACIKPPLPADSAPALTLVGIEVEANEEVRRAGPRAALPVPGAFALFVQVSRPSYLSLARKSGTSLVALLSVPGTTVLYPASSAPVRFPPAGQWLRLDDLSDGDRLCLSANGEQQGHPADWCGATGILLLWSRDKGETHPQPPPPATETKAPASPSPPPPPPPPRTEGSR